MIDTLSLVLRRWYAQRRSRQTGIVFVVLGLLLLSRLAEYLVVSYDEAHWETTVQANTARHLATAAQAFESFQRSTRRVAAELAVHPALTAYLDGSSKDISRMFGQVARVSRDYEVGVEVYDDHGAMISWQGSSGPQHKEEVYWALAGRLSSYVTHGPIYAQLFVVTPVRTESRIVGAVLVRRTIEVNYPFSNKFINSEGLAVQLSRQLGVPVAFSFGEHALPRKDGRYASAPLTGLEGRKVGVVHIQHQTQSSYLESVRATFAQFNAGLTILMIVFVATLVIGLLREKAVGVFRMLGLVMLIWLVRYALLWLELPEVFLTSGVFDPTYFASTFGSGIAKSIGDLTLTCLALFLCTAILVDGCVSSAATVVSWWQRRRMSLRLTAAVLITLLIFWLLRGYGAVVRSAVFDSTLRYSDPRVIIPSFELGLMVVNLFVVSFCLVVALAGVTAFLVSMLRKGTGVFASPLSAWMTVAGLYLMASVSFGLFQQTPLMSTPYRLACSFGVLGFTLWLWRLRIRRRGVVTLQTSLLGLLLSALFFYPLLDANVHERDRDRVELFAAEVLRPVDSWMETLVDQALQSFQTDETIDLLSGGEPDAVQRLAFEHWAKSAVSKEGYNCVFAVSDTGGHELSRFAVGGQAIADIAAGLVSRRSPSAITVEQLGSGINASQVYTGVIPLLSGRRRVAYATVVVAAGRSALFRGEAPSILRSAPQEDLESFYRPVTLSEFHEGKLITTTNPVVPFGFDLPASVVSSLMDSTVTMLWVELEIGDKVFDTFCVRRMPPSHDIVALSIERADVRWYLVDVVKMMVYYATIVVGIFLVFYLWRWLNGRRYMFTFRDRLLGALLLVALVPVIVVAMYGRSLARERFMESINTQLEQETANVDANLEERLADAHDSTAALLSAGIAEQIAAEAGTDFNLYVANALAVSSRPELYEAGILDLRLSGTAHLNAVLLGKRYHVETENIGQYQYAVGYRPLFNDRGKVRAIVSVPTLYRQDKLDEEVSRTNALIFAVLGVLLLAIIVVASVFAASIAAPIHKLTEATKRVSKGELDVPLGIPASDGEIAELVRAFETMTMDLKRSRDELVRAERELAWKEMAKQVAHEIKNPLTPMKLSMQHLRQTYKDKVPDLDHIFDEVSRTIIDQIDALGRIASEFSNFARMPRARQELCDVNTVLTESVRLFERDARVRFDLSTEPNLPAIVADREELRRAFINLVRNGIQAMNNAGRMIVSTKLVGDSIQIIIRDFGHGIPPDIRAKLFEPNFSTKSDGMGLGLAIVRKTIDDLGGHITIDSGENEGTTVTVMLPIRSESDRSADHA